MYPRIAIVTTADHKTIVFGTNAEYMSAEETQAYLQNQGFGYVDVLSTACIPNDGYPYFV